MDINMETIERLNDSIKTNIELFIILNKEKLYEEFAPINIFSKKEIIYNAIGYTMAEEATNSPKELYDYLGSSERDKDIKLLDEVSDSVIIDLYSYVDEVFENKKEYFPIDTHHTGRYDLLFKGVLHYIKLIRKTLKNQMLHRDSNTPTGIDDLSLNKAVDLHFEKMLDCAVAFCKCYEADSKNNIMCREILDKNFKEYYRYQYKLDQKAKEKLKQDVNLIIQNINNQNGYTKDIDFDESKVHLSNTLSLAQKYIDDIICNNDKLKSDEFKILIDTYKQLFTNSRDRFKTSQKTNNFLIELKKANMFHRMTYEGKVIYPFLFDLIVMNFIYSINHIQYKSVITDVNKIMKIVNETKYLYLENDSDENYHFNEFKRAAEEIPYEYKILDNPTILLIKHYSEFLNCEYNTVAAIFRQLRFEFTDANKSVYNLLLPQRNIDLNFDDDYFRKLSLYIIQ